MNQQINLYQPIFRTRRKVFSARTMIQTLAILIIALAVLYGFAAWQTAGLATRVAALQQQKSDATARLAALDKVLASRKPSAALTQALAAAKRNRQARRALLDKLSNRGRGKADSGFGSILAGIARTPVPGLWLTQVTLADGGRVIQLAGKTSRATRVPRLVSELAAVPVLANVEFKQLKISRKSKAPAGAPLQFVLSTKAEKSENKHAGSN